MSSNTRKSAFLGMPYGTASNKLRKMVLFDLLCQMKHNCCFKCKKEIENVDQLSMEHMRPWEGRSKELFWDLNNISFSHLRCNKPHKYPSRVIQDDKIQCNKCKEFLEAKFYHSDKSTKIGIYYICKKCRQR